MTNSGWAGKHWGDGFSAHLWDDGRSFELRAVLPRGCYPAEHETVPACRNRRHRPGTPLSW
jgi:hypothetical protein